MPQALDFSTDILEIEPHFESSSDVFSGSSFDEDRQFPPIDNLLVSPIFSVERSSHMELARKLLSKSLELSEVDVLPSCAISSRRQSANTTDKDSSSSKKSNSFYFPGAPEIFMEDGDSAVNDEYDSKLLLSDLCAESCCLVNRNLATGPDYRTAAVAALTDSGNASQSPVVVDNHHYRPSGPGNEVVEEIWRKYHPNQSISIGDLEADARQPLNLPHIVHSVCSLGGIDQVRSKKLWTTVALQQKLSAKALPPLKAFYDKFIAPHEEEIWTSMIENIEHDRARIPSRNGPSCSSRNRNTEIEDVRKRKRRRTLVHHQPMAEYAVSPTLRQ